MEYNVYIKDRTDWENYIKYYTFCYNISPHAAFNDKYSPFEVIFSKNVNLPLALKSNTVDPIYNIDSYAREVKYRMQTVNKKVQELLKKNKTLQKTTYDKKAKPIDLKLQDKVLLVDYTSHKLKPIYKGPYTITKIDNNKEYIFTKHEHCGSATCLINLNVFSELQFEKMSKSPVMNKKGEVAPTT